MEKKPLESLITDKLVKRWNIIWNRSAKATKSGAITLKTLVKP